MIGLAGVLVGASIPWFRSWMSERKDCLRNARYLAMCVVRVLDKYVESAAGVVLDDGLRETYEIPQPNIENLDPLRRLEEVKRNIEALQHKRSETVVVFPEAAE